MPHPRTTVAPTIIVAITAAVTAAIIIFIPRDPPLPPQVLPWEWDDVASVTVRPVRPEPELSDYTMTSAEDLAAFHRAVERAELTVTPNPDGHAIASMVRVVVTLDDGTRYRFRSSVDDLWMAHVGTRGGSIDIKLHGASLSQFLDARRNRAG